MILATWSSVNWFLRSCCWGKGGCPTLKDALAAAISSRVGREPSSRGRRAWENNSPHTLTHLSCSGLHSDNQMW